MNVWIGEGRLVRDPELNVVGGGVEVCRITVAIDRSRKDKGGNKQTDFVDCTAFGKTGAFIDKYFKRGDGILMRGKFQSDKYTAKDGTNRTKWAYGLMRLTFRWAEANRKTAIRIMLGRLEMMRRRTLPRSPMCHKRIFRFKVVRHGLQDV